MYVNFYKYFFYGMFVIIIIVREMLYVFGSLVFLICVLKF